MKTGLTIGRDCQQTSVYDLLNAPAAHVHIVGIYIYKKKCLMNPLRLSCRAWFSSTALHFDKAAQLLDM